MKVKKFGFKGQEYAAPRAENVMVAQEGILCASVPAHGVNTSVYTGVNETW